MKEFKLSIIIPIYNVELYLEDCLNSVLENPHDDWEYILINDGSTDNSLKIAQYYEKKYVNVKVISQKNQGLSAARNTGIKKSNGNYLFFLDSDDYIDVKELEKMVNIAIDNNVDLLSGECTVMLTKNNALIIDEKIQCNNVPKNKIINNEDYLLYQLNKGTFQTIVVLNLYKSEIIKNNSLYFLEGFLHEDEEWTPKVILKCTRLMSVDNNFYFYRKRENSITTKKKSEKNFNDLKIIRNTLADMYTKSIKNKHLLDLLLDDLVKRKIYDYATCRNTTAIKEKKFFKTNAKTLRNKLASNMILYLPRVYFYLKFKVKHSN